MEYSTLGRTGLRVSRLSLGAMTFGAGSGIWGGRKCRPQLRSQSVRCDRGRYDIVLACGCRGRRKVHFPTRRTVPPHSGAVRRQAARATIMFVVVRQRGFVNQWGGARLRPAQSCRRPWRRS